MELGMIGLGSMGANMAQRLVRGGHRVVGFDPEARGAQALVEQSAPSPPTRWRRWSASSPRRARCG